MKNNQPINLLEIKNPIRMENMKRALFFHYVLLLPLLLLSSLLADIPGDVNFDGQLNIADLVRLQAMINGIVSPSPEADLNFDQQVNSVDALLMEDALKGNPLPVFLAQTSIGSEGGTFEHNESGFKVIVPDGVFSEPTRLVLTAGKTDMLNDYGVSETVSNSPLLLFGLPRAENLEFSFALPADTRSDNATYSLMLGQHVLPRNAAIADWHFQLLNQPADGVSYQNGRLIWKPALMPADTAQTRTGSSNEEAFMFDIVRNWLGGTFYESNHFRLQPLTSTTTNSELNRMESLLLDLENAFQTAITMGFPENKRTEKWGDAATKIKVIIKKPDKAKFYGLIGSDEDAESAWCNPPGYWSPPFLELNTGAVTSPNRREIVSHEFFHYLQYYYSNNTGTLWLDEMTATWMEGKVSSEGANYCPTTYKNPRAPINGLYRFSSLFNENNAGFHGYSISAFAYYLSKRYDWKNDFWHQVFSHADYTAGKGMTPLRASALSMHAGGLDFLYLVFLRNYLSDAVSDGGSSTLSAFGENGRHSVSIFQNTDQNECDWKRFAENGKISKIEKSSELSGKIENDFQVQDLGAATWLFTFPKPKEVIHKGMYARVQIDDTCSDLFAVLFKGPDSIGITKIESVEHDEEKEKRILDFSLAALVDSERLMNIGLVAVNANSSTGDSPEIKTAKMTVQFLGLISLPSETTYFDLWGERLLQASADLEIVGIDPSNALGEYSIDTWPGATTSDHHNISSFRIVTAQLNANYPVSLRLRATILPLDLGEVSSTDNLNDEFTTHAVPTGNAVIFVDTRHAGDENFYSSVRHDISLSDLASPSGFELDLNSANPSDTINVTVRPIYTVTGAGSGTGENLNCYTMIFIPPAPPANP